MGLLFPIDLPAVAADGASGDEWYTPRFILEWIGEIALDPCYSPRSLVQARAVLDLRRGNDGLLDAWAPVGSGVIFANPPFSNTSGWLRACRYWARELGRVVVCLVPAFPGDNPWHVEVWPEVDGVRLTAWIAGRVDFVNPDGRVAEKGRGHGLLLFGPQRACIDVAAGIARRALGHAQAPVWTRRVDVIALAAADVLALARELAETSP